ncbi:beta-N-acetylhexosaminidase [Massilia cavernae]|uniref:Beta-N-acetylhexosaminidase n=1 Tax=Massilia cavernae TaxID=2320864 RepID=A0A418Y572_9BURK|nr:beta-N-acetylhexosaminidase [Massilia cavernae]
MIRIAGTELAEATARFVRDNEVRGACLFRQNMTDAVQLARLTGALRDAMGPNALIALDQEGGAVVRSTWVPAPPSAMALGAADDADLAYRTGAAVARAVKSLGFNWNFAPVLDLNNNPHNPVIAERSFGADPQRATELAMAWMAGSESEGVACCVKHFPGHGDTHVDSHRALPTVDKPRAELEQFEFAPFRMAAEIAPAMMTAHIVYPALDPEHPATLSRRILGDLLRGEWKYDGVVITDGMDMHAIAGKYGVGNAAVLALQAGADMVMAIGSPETQEQTVDAIARAIESGELPMDEVRRKLERLARLARTYECAQCYYAAEEDDRTVMAEGWQRALTARGNPQRPPQGAKVRLVMRQDAVSDGVSEAGVTASVLSKVLARRFDVDVVTYADAEAFDWNSLPDDGRFVILASTSRVRYGPKAKAAFKPDLHLALWNPYQALDFDAPALITYGFAAPALDAVDGWLSGALEANGHVPVPGFTAPPQ